MHKTHLHGTIVLASKLAAASPPDFTKSTGLQEPPDEDQGSSNSCTSQAFGYHFWQLTGCQILRNDIYSHTFLPREEFNQLSVVVKGVAGSGGLLKQVEKLENKVTRYVLILSIVWFIFSVFAIASWQYFLARLAVPGGTTTNITNK